MRIESLKTFVVGNPPPGFGGRYFLFLKLRTTCGIEGVGEVYAATVGPEAMVTVLEDAFIRYLEGRNPFQVEALFRRLYGSGFTFRPDATMMGVASGLEMACWDIIGKALERPCYDLLGGLVNERLRTYTYLYPQPDQDAAEFYASPDLSAECAARMLAQGFTAVKFDPAGPYSVFDGRQPDLPALARSEAFCKAIREAVGDRADLLFGTHGQFTASGAIRLAQRLAPYDPLWFEEPCPPDDVGAMAQVAAASPVPIAAGERLTTKWEFARLLERRALAIVQMNLGRVGGLLEAKKIAGMAEAFSAQIAPHLYCGPIVGAANAQIAACSPNFLILESIGRWDGFYADLLETPMQWEDGYLIPPTAPGLGVTLNEAVALAHPYTGDRLHLEMTPHPFDSTRDAGFAGG